jgi:hypothetical protein
MQTIRRGRMASAAPDREGKNASSKGKARLTPAARNTWRRLK